MSKSDVLKTVQQFMLQENRPYAVHEVLEKCGKDLGKAAIQKALDSLVSKEILLAKSYGKHKIYFAKQNVNNQELKKQMQTLKQKLSQAQNILKNKESELNDLEIKLKSLNKVKSLATLEEERDQLLNDIRHTNEKLKSFQAQEMQNKLNSQDVKKILTKYENVSLAYRKRKRMCNDMLEAIMEGYPKTKKALIADIGLETDEDVGFNVQLKR
ncbi:homologous-pairing protein 2 homolog [Lucilia cuprina]|uniref:homologous-pairing protein 2 homolog n=1 Tax=Lucilia cuprina TaxID=7375 RepID=UPI001F067EEC|nr:homologous-pairing protein 2 homolog [Lucilia cuprina]XP_046811589.1 homologous-pairing protein 2 homolog [Lucilia cuprina]XP_046811590.1 homologous-pairing protein 2 homolog [Lucilia cuprina]